MTAFADRLLAKSVRGVLTRSATLPGHIADTLEAAEAILATTAHSALDQLALAEEHWKEAFRRAVLLGTFIHDPGKANDGFQPMVRGERDAQPVRHEALSLLLVTQVAAIRAWLTPFTEVGTHDRVIWAAALWAAGGHHLKLDARRAEAFPSGARATEVSLLVSHADFDAWLKLGTAHLNLPPPPAFATDLRWSCLEADEDGVPLRLRRFVNEEARPLLRSLSADERWFVAAVKATVIAADVAGSARPAPRRASVRG